MIGVNNKQYEYSQVGICAEITRDETSLNQMSVKSAYRSFYNYRIDFREIHVSGL